MAKVREIWNKFKTVESLYELQSEVDQRLERTRICVTKCTQIVHELSSFFEERRLLAPETKEMLFALMKDLRRIDDFMKYKERVLAGYLAEIDLMKKLRKNRIDSRYTGEHTAIDVFAKSENKFILIQVKGTGTNSRAIGKEDLRDLLEDSLYFENYPALDFAFRFQNEYNHFIIPIEELMASIKGESVTISRSKIEKEKIRCLPFDEFVQRFSSCEFPVMKFDKAQFESWLKKVEK